MVVNGPGFVAHAQRQDAAEAELLALHREERRLELRAARLLARIDETYHYAYKGCSGIAHYGELHGRSGREARMLAAVGRALELRPALEGEILAGKVSLDAAAALSQVFANPALMRDGDDWLAWAEQWSARELEREVRKRLRELETGEPTSVLHAVLTASGREKFERARLLACRKHGKALCEGETVEVLSDHYLDSFDPARQRSRRRRAPVGVPGRYVTAEVDRQVKARHGDRCPVPGCDHQIWMDRAHIVPHRHGGSREAANLYYLCRQHHILYDAGVLQIDGPPARPVIRLHGRVLAARECSPAPP